MSSGTAIPPTAAAVAAAAAPSRSQIATWAPSAVNRSATARPIPDAPPVTTARRPAKRPSDTLPTPVPPRNFARTLADAGSLLNGTRAASEKKHHNDRRKYYSEHYTVVARQLQALRGIRPLEFRFLYLGSFRDSDPPPGPMQR